MNNLVKMLFSGHCPEVMSGIVELSTRQDLIDNCRLMMRNSLGALSQTGLEDGEYAVADLKYRMTKGTARCLVRIQIRDDVMYLQEALHSSDAVSEIPDMILGRIEAQLASVVQIAQKHVDKRKEMESYVTSYLQGVKTKKEPEQPKPAKAPYTSIAGMGSREVYLAPGGLGIDLSSLGMLDGSTMVTSSGGSESRMREIQEEITGKMDAFMRKVDKATSPKAKKSKVSKDKPLKTKKGKK